MLSYQHAYHAGNFADMHKHALLLALLREACAQSPRLHYFDSHAGDGLYDLEAATARKTREAESGILRTSMSPPSKAILHDLVTAQTEITRAQGKGRFYAGSPLLAAHMLRPGDRLSLCERHPGALAALRRACQHDARVEILAQDGVATVASYPLPPDWDSVVLIDPSYEQKHEMADIIRLAGTVVRRWRKARVLVWFPLWADGRHQMLIDGLGQIRPGRLSLSLVHRPPTQNDQLRLIGSGMAHLARADWPALRTHSQQIGAWLKLATEERLSSKK